MQILNNKASRSCALPNSSRAPAWYQNFFFVPGFGARYIRLSWKVRSRLEAHARCMKDEALLDGTVEFQQITPPVYGKRSSTSKPPLDVNPEPVPVSSGEGSPFEDRICVFSENRLPARKSTGIFNLFWIAYNDRIIILLTIAAIGSLSLGIYEAIDGGLASNGWKVWLFALLSSSLPLSLLPMTGRRKGSLPNSISG